MPLIFYMEEDADYYRLRTTIMNAWHRNDKEMLDRILVHLVQEHKPGWFRRIIYKHSFLSATALEDMAEDAFITTWDAFTKNGLAGKIQLTEPTYTGYFFRSFKNNFLKNLARGERLAQAEKEFGYENPDVQVEMEMKEIDFFSARTRHCLNRLTEEARQMLIWYHIEELTHDEIAARKNIKRKTSIQLVSRYGIQFLKLWQQNK